jgi:hypothetical protein
MRALHGAAPRKGRTDVKKYLVGGKKKFASLEEASAFAEAQFQKSGVVLGIEEVAKKLSPKQQKAAVAARIQNSIYGFIIPMMSIPKLYKLQEEAIAAGKSDEELKAIVAAFPGVEASNR